MLSQAFITEIKGDEIHAMQLVTEACLHCQTGCIQRGKEFIVSNKRNFPVEKGNIVRIGLSRYKRGIHALSSLLIPLTCAVAGYFFSGEIAKKIGLEYTEVFKAACVMFSLAASSGLVFIISRSSLHFSKPEILQVL